MYVEKISYGMATFRFHSNDLNRLATACDTAITEISDEEDGELRDWLEAALSAFVAAWTATKVQMDAPICMANGEAYDQSKILSPDS